GLVPLIGLLHLLHRKRTRLVVPSVIVWTENQSQQNLQRGWRKIGNLIALLVSLVILLLMVLALAKPDVRDWFGKKSTLLVLDARLRMQATDPNGISAFDKATAAAKAVAKRASERHPVGLIVFPGGPIVPFSSEAKPLIEVLSQLEPTEASGNLTNSVAQILDAQPEIKNVLVLTDRDVPELAKSIASVQAFGAPGQNVAITAFDARPSADSAAMTDIFLRTSNFSDSEINAQIQFLLDDQLIDAREQRVPANGTAEIILQMPTSDLRASQTGVLRATLTAGDAVSADDTAQILFPTGAVPRVLIVSANDGFLEKAISADSDISYELLRPDAWRPEFAKSFPVIVFDGWSPPEFGNNEWNTGNYFFVGTAPSQILGPEMTATTVGLANPDSPLLKGIKLEGMQINTTRPLARPTAAGWESVLEADDQTLLLTYTNPAAPSVRSAILAFSPSESDFAQRAAFPLFVSNTIHWLLVTQPPVTLIAGKDAPPTAGVYPVGSIAGTSPAAAVNPASVAESDVRGAFGSSTIYQNNHGQLFPMLWELLLIAAILLLVFEWIAFHRRWFT
ncbi:MAG: hypothetical protein ACOVMP_05030, partial [Chthoniobacterales bacterium]